MPEPEDNLDDTHPYFLKEFLTPPLCGATVSPQDNDDDVRVEMDSSSSAPCRGSGDTLTGLTFGEKIYFEDGGGSSSRAPAVPERKGKGVQPQPQPPRCQVEGCHADLTGAKAYYCRHKVCGVHSKTPVVVVAGKEQRFCQQCSRFHLLSEFDQRKRSCRRRLAGHNQRRRKPVPGPQSGYGRLLSLSCEDSSQYRGFLMDFRCPSLPHSERDEWPTVRASGQGVTNLWSPDTPQGAIAVHEAHSYAQCPNSAAELPPGQCLAGVSDSSCALSLLSNQPWGTIASRNPAVSLSADNSFGGAPMAHPIINSYMNSQWGFKGHGASSSSVEIQHELELGHAADGGSCRFSGELELALQGNRQCPDLGPS